MLLLENQGENPDEEQRFAKYQQELQVQYADVFATDHNTLPPVRDVNCVIPTVPGIEPPSRQPYRLAPEHLKEMQCQLTELLVAGLIGPSSSPYAAPVLFVKKHDGSLRMCIDYRALNKITIKNKYPLPRIDDLLESLGHARYFSKIDLKSAYHQIRVAESDIPKTAFRTQYGHFEYLVMPFGLTNAPAVFQKLINHLFRKQLRICVLAYLDDILIYSKSEAEHKQHLHEIFSILRKEKLYASFKKCEFWRTQVHFVGHVVTRAGLYPTEDKLLAIKNWPAPTDVKGVQSFLGLVNYYRKFLPNIAKTVQPLTNLTKKHVTFRWTILEQAAFDQIKQCIASAPVLIIPDYAKPFVIHTDASDIAIGAVLMQDHGRGFATHRFSIKKLIVSATELLYL